MKIVSDSSSNVFLPDDPNYTTVPLKISVGEREFSDEPGLDIGEMLRALRTYKGRTRTSCPNIYEWHSAFQDADEVFALTISGNISGSFTTADQARRDVLAESPEKKIAIIDTRSTGPEMELLIERLKADIAAGNSFEEIERDVRQYGKSTHLLFALESMNNLARNGRVNPVVAKIAGVLGIRVVGVASAEGRLELLHKPRGREKMIACLFDEMLHRRYKGGKVRISHCVNPEVANAMRARILEVYPSADVTVSTTGALCSYYAEEGGLLVGFEGGET